MKLTWLERIISFHDVDSKEKPKYYREKFWMQTGIRLLYIQLSLPHNTAF